MAQSPRPRPPREKDLLPDPTPAKDRQQPERPREQPAVRLVDLRPKFEKGQELRYTLAMNSSTRQSTLTPAPKAKSPRTPAKPGSQPDAAPDASANADSSSRVVMGLRLKVTDVSQESGATVDLVIESIKAAVQSGDAKLDFDSTKKSNPDDPAAALFQSIAGTTLTLKVDRDGNISSVTGGESLTALGQFVSPGGGGQGKPGDLFSSLFSAHKASGQAAVGESWENSDRIDSPLMGGFRMITRHTLTSVRGREAYVDVRGRVEPSSEAPGAAPFTLQNVQHQGTYIWDTGAGALKQMDSTMSSEVRARIGEEDKLVRSESKMSVSRQR
jgi:hypothetical protein